MTWQTSRWTLSELFLKTFLVSSGAAPGAAPSYVEGKKTVSMDKKVRDLIDSVPILPLKRI
jgi:hypothetical protein